MTRKVTFYFSNGLKSRTFESDKGIGLVHELAVSMQGDEDVITVALMREADQGTVLLVRKEALLGMALRTPKKVSDRKARESED